MASVNLKHIQSHYFGVSGAIKEEGSPIHWYVNMKGVGKNRFETEKEAAIAVDKILIYKGKEPKNILKRNEIK